MKTLDVIRAWKDAAYRESLSEEYLRTVPQNPAGVVDLTDEQLKHKPRVCRNHRDYLQDPHRFHVRRFHCCK
jgi:mersacidin/lichenicidin family type 2 lantibiotic